MLQCFCHFLPVFIPSTNFVIMLRKCGNMDNKKKKTKGDKKDRMPLELLTFFKKKLSLPFVKIRPSSDMQLLKNYKEESKIFVSIRNIFITGTATPNLNTLD